MKKQLSFLTRTLAATLSCALIGSPLLFSSPLQAESAKPATPATESLIPWTTKYEDALQKAKQDNKPLFLYFTGSDWCVWCKKMDKEILSTQDFYNLVGDKFVFVKIDFPIYSTLDKATIAQNEELKKKFDIQGFPTIILLTSEGKQMAILNYRPGGGRSYAEYLLKLLAEQEQFKKGMQSLSMQDEESLQKLYATACQMGLDNEARDIIKTALSKAESSNNDSLFFLTEYYRQLLNEGKMASPEAKALREKLLSKDPHNKMGIQYNVAVLDFEANAENLPDHKTADLVVKPLTNYLTRFGDQDPEKRWRIEMTVSQVYRSKNQYDQALKYAKTSLDHAPEEMKNNVAQAIVFLEQSASNIGSADK